MTRRIERHRTRQRAKPLDLIRCDRQKNLETLKAGDQPLRNRANTSRKTRAEIVRFAPTQGWLEDI